jgi:hypothetical protein
MLTARFQLRLQAATCRRARPAGRSAALKVVAFKNGDEEQQVQKQEQKQDMLSAKVTFQLPMHGECLAAACFVVLLCHATSSAAGR